MQHDKGTRHQTTGQTDDYSIMAQTSCFSGCCICMRLFTCAHQISDYNFYKHSKVTLFCGKTQEQIFMQLHAFLQGFLFCEVLCALLDRHATQGKCEIPRDVKEVKSEDNVLDFVHPVSPCFPVSPNSPVTPVSFKIPRSSDEVSFMAGDPSSTYMFDSVEPENKSVDEGKSRGMVMLQKDEHDTIHHERKSLHEAVGKRKTGKLRSCTVHKKHVGSERKTQVKKDTTSFTASLKKQTHFRNISRDTENSNNVSTSMIEGVKPHSNKINQKKKIMVCRVCGKKCIGQAGLSVHTQIRHAGEKAVECEICGDRFLCSRDCEKHRKKVHHKTEGVCHICGKHFKYRHALVAHIKAHTGVKGFVCEHCGKAFLRMTTLCSHRKRAHCCKECQAELVSGQCPVHPSHSQSREKRVPVLDSLNMLQCRECSETLSSLQSLEAHMRAHRMQRPYHCRVCGNGFHTLSSLTKHSKQHQEKRFKCNLCEKTFTYKCNMQKHLETHVEGRPFQCEFCSKTFKTKGVMEKHLAMHVEDRQFKCHLCGKGLTRLQTLKNHMMKMHPDSGIGGATRVGDS